eukprot:scaffold1666_cov424-Prasinococcus_capsulatus_cf.AAC.6
MPVSSVACTGPWPGQQAIPATKVLAGTLHNRSDPAGMWPRVPDAQHGRTRNTSTGHRAPAVSRPWRVKS